MVVERAGREGFTTDAKPQLHELVRGNPSLNRELFWADVAEQRVTRSRGPIICYWHVYFVGNAPLWGFSEGDLDWLRDDLKTRSSIEDRQIALSANVSVLQPAGRLGSEERNLRAAIGTDVILLAELQQALTPPSEDPATRTFAFRSALYELKAKAQEVADKEILDKIS